MVVHVHEGSDLKLELTINVKNAKFLKKGFARGPVTCSTDCSNSSLIFRKQIDSVKVKVRRICRTPYYVATCKIWIE